MHEETNIILYTSKYIRPTITREIIDPFTNTKDQTALERSICLSSTLELAARHYSSHSYLGCVDLFACARCIHHSTESVSFTIFKNLIIEQFLFPYVHAVYDFIIFLQ